MCHVQPVVANLIGLRDKQARSSKGTASLNLRLTEKNHICHIINVWSELVPSTWCSHSPFSQMPLLEDVVDNWKLVQPLHGIPQHRASSST